jgi:hypothetical protein
VVFNTLGRAIGLSDPEWEFDSRACVPRVLNGAVADRAGARAIELSPQAASKPAGGSGPVLLSNSAISRILG